MQTSIRIPITLVKEDLKLLGNTVFCEYNTTSFIVSNYVEYIFLRSIMNHFGYNASDPEDYMRENGRCDMIVRTTYPWNKYKEL